MSDLLQRLPHELWVSTMRFLVQGDYAGPLPYLSVSTLWSDSLVREPILWTTIITHGGEDETARIRTFLHLSSPYPLHVRIADTEWRNRPKEVMAMISSQAHRIESLVITDQLYDRNYGQRGLRRLDTLPATTEKLHQINQLFTGLTNWSSLKTLRCAPNGLLVPLFSNSFVNMGDTISHLSSLALDGLIFARAIRSIGLKYIPMEGGRDLDEVPWDTHLTELSSMKRLEEIYIEIPGIFLINLLPILNSFHMLTSIHLEIDWSTRSKYGGAWPWSTLKLRSIQISLGYIPLEIFDELLTTLVESTTTEYLEIFSMNLGYTDWNWDAAQAHSLLRTISRVRDLTLYLWHPPESPVHLEDLGSETIEFNRLLHLNVYPPCLLHCLHTPNILSLETSASYSRGGEDTPGWRCCAAWKNENLRELSINEGAWRRLHEFSMSPSRIEARWSSLTHLDLRSNEIPEDIVYISSLQVINIDFMSFHGSLPEDSVFRKLFLHVLRRPHALPNLRTIQSISYPPWELLFEAIRRRNQVGNRSLKQLFFQRFPCYTFLKILVHLLRGRSDIFTQYNADQVIQDDYRNHKDSGLCVECPYYGHSLCFDAAVSLQVDSTWASIHSISMDTSTSYWFREEDRVRSSSDHSYRHCTARWSEPSSNLVDINPFTLDEPELPILPIPTAWIEQLEKDLQAHESLPSSAIGV